MSRNLNGLVPLAGAVLFCACASGGMGSVPPTVVELYDMADPAGVIELEIDRQGNLVEVEADVPVSAVPAAARKAVEKAVPGGDIFGAEREINASGEMWELKVRAEGRAWEFVVDDAGTIYETEKELAPGEAPAEVLAAADRAIPAGAFKSIEVIERGNVTEYHVKKTKDGASYKIVLSPKGRVIRTVREARAEIEIPIDS